MSNLTTFTPLMRQSVGFDRFNDLFESILGDKEDRFDSYPPYNIEKTDEGAYVITLAVAGFSEEDLNVVTQDDCLIVSGSHSDKESKKSGEILHRGIATRSFERSFRLADHIRVTDATIENGLLTISLVREVPEEKKPRMITINKPSVGFTSKKDMLAKKKDK